MKMAKPTKEKKTNAKREVAEENLDRYTESALVTVPIANFNQEFRSRFPLSAKTFRCSEIFYLANCAEGAKVGLNNLQNHLRAASTGV